MRYPDGQGDSPQLLGINQNSALPDTLRKFIVQRFKELEHMPKITATYSPNKDLRVHD